METYTKADIIELITRQYDVKQQVLNYMISKLLDLSDEEVKREFEKASGARLEKIGSRYLIKF